MHVRCLRRCCAAYGCNSSAVSRARCLHAGLYLVLPSIGNHMIISYLEKARAFAEAQAESSC